MKVERSADGCRRFSVVGADAGPSDGGIVSLNLDKFITRAIRWPSPIYKGRIMPSFMGSETLSVGRLDITLSLRFATRRFDEVPCCSNDSVGIDTESSI